MAWAGHHRHLPLAQPEFIRLPLPCGWGCWFWAVSFLAFGMTIVIRSQAGTGPNDLVAVVLSDKLGKALRPGPGRGGLFFALSGFALGGVLGLGTVICAFLVGPCRPVVFPGE